MTTYTIAALILLAGTPFVFPAKPDPFTNWPAGESPREIGKRGVGLLRSECFKQTYAARRHV